MRSERYDISVVIGTYNRSGMLVEALESVLDQRSGDGAEVCYEVVVVDNNSTDGTRRLVERYIEMGHTNLSYLFEERQGVSYARNCGVENSKAPIIAFTDDDVRVARDWIANIKRAFDENPRIDFLGGKILPRWGTAPPAWLNKDHWWALSLLDYGDEPFYVNANNPLCLPTANASFRRDLFNRVGQFSPDFSGREDHEFLLRLWFEGACGMYVPNVVVIAEVQPERLKRAYHRKWNTTTGRFNSAMRLNDVMGARGSIVGEASDAVTLFGVPGFIYRSLVSAVFGLISSTLLGQHAASMRRRNELYYLTGYIQKRYQENSRLRKRSGISEVGSFLKNLMSKKLTRCQRANRNRTKKVGSVPTSEVNE